MRKWKVADSTREFMVDEVFSAGYGGEREIDLLRWTRQEMLDECSDKDLLSLFERYVTWYPPTPGRDQRQFEREVEAEIALDDLLCSRS
jgi:hypothetical protein